MRRLTNLVPLVPILVAALVPIGCTNPTDQTGSNPTTDATVEPTTPQPPPNQPQQPQTPAVAADWQLEPSAGSAIADGQEQITVTISALDDQGQPVADAQLTELYLSVGGRYVQELPYESDGQGVFTTVITSTFAHQHTVVAIDEQQRVYQTNIDFIPGEPAQVQLKISEAKATSNGPMEASATITIQDEHGNPVNVDPSLIYLESTVGEVSTVEPSGTGYAASLTADDYLLGDVTAYYGADLFAIAEVAFPPVVLRGGEADHHQPAVRVGEQLAVYPVIQIPESFGSLSYFTMDLELDDTETQLVDFESLSNSGCMVEWVEPIVGPDGTMITLGGFCEGLVSGEVAPVKLNFSHEQAREISIKVDGVTLYDSEYKEHTPKQYLAMWNAMLERLTWFRWKEERTIKVKLWLAPNHAKPSDIQEDLTQAQLIFTLNALRCTCEYFVKLDVEKKQLEEDEWKQIAGDDQKINATERGGAKAVNGGKFYDGKRYNIYYGQILGSALGVTNHGSKACFVDSTVDPDNRTMAHELGHLVSGKGKVLDQGKPGAAAQGGNDEQNLYHYDETGDLLTKKQCDEITAGL